jgi:hypothetical protein
MSDHIPDLTKMIGDTPISDLTPHNVAELGMLCRKLERQLNAANAEIEEKRKDVVWLATEKAKLENYVMRLEEAGDEMARWLSSPRNIGGDRLMAAEWNKTKEAKP